MINRRKISSSLKAIASQPEEPPKEWAAGLNDPKFQKFVQDWINSDVHGFCEFMEQYCQEEMHEMHFGLDENPNRVYVISFDGGDWWVEEWSMNLLSTPQLQKAKQALLDKFSVGH